MPDMGGRRRAPDNKDIYEEGLQIPILKLYDAGRPNETLIEMICQNVRVPDEVMGDIHAMVGACEKMSIGLRNLLAEYGQDDLGAIAAEIIGRSEAAMRRAVSDIPDGVYRSITPIDSFDADHPLEIHCTMEVRDESLAVDFTGSSLQNESPLNSVLGYTSAYSIYALKCVLLPNVPNNEGNTLPF